MKALELGKLSYAERRLSAKRTWRKRFVFRKSNPEDVDSEKEIVGRCIDQRWSSTVNGVTFTC
jgi:hypothetical protein